MRRLREVFPPFLWFCSDLIGLFSHCEILIALQEKSEKRSNIQQKEISIPNSFRIILV